VILHEKISRKHRIKFFRMKFCSRILKSKKSTLNIRGEIIFNFLIEILYVKNKWQGTSENFTCDADAFKAFISLSVYIKGSTYEMIRRYLEKFNSMTLD